MQGLRQLPDTPHVHLPLRPDRDKAPTVGQGAQVEHPTLVRLQDVVHQHRSGGGPSSDIPHAQHARVVARDQQVPIGRVGHGSRRTRIEPEQFMLIPFRAREDIQYAVLATDHQGFRVDGMPGKTHGCRRARAAPSAAFKEKSTSDHVLRRLHRPSLSISRTKRQSGVRLDCNQK